MKKIINTLLLSILFFVLTACFSVNEIASISINKAPDAYVELGATIEASEFTVNIKTSDGQEYNNKSITDAMLTVYGLVDDKLDTSTVGKKTVTIVYDTASVKISYFVADSLVYNYTDFTEAMVSVEGIIVLMSDIQVSVLNGVVIPAGHTKTFELNGHSLSFTAEAVGTTALITNYGTLTIQDSTDIERNGSGTGKITGFAVSPDMQEIPGYASNTITNHSTLIVNSGIIENTADGLATYPIDNVSNYLNEVNCTINGGKIINTKRAEAIRVNSQSNDKNNKLVINNGIFIGGWAAVWLHNPQSSPNLTKAELEINGGIFQVDEDQTMDIQIYYQNHKYANFKVTINGGTFSKGIVYSNSILPENLNINSIYSSIVSEYNSD